MPESLIGWITFCTFGTILVAILIFVAILMLGLWWEGIQLQRLESWKLDGREPYYVPAFCWLLFRRVPDVDLWHKEQEEYRKELGLNHEEFSKFKMRIYEYREGLKT